MGGVPARPSSQLVLTAHILDDFMYRFTYCTFLSISSVCVCVCVCVCLGNWRMCKVDVHILTLLEKYTG